MTITTVVFDFDGVIADTEPLHLGAFQQVFGERGWTLDESAYFDRYLGCDDRGLVMAFADDTRLDLNAADIDALVAAKARHFGRALAAGEVLFPGAKQTIERLASRFVLGIASGSLHHEIVEVLTAAGLANRFPVIVAADDVSSTKPSPEPYLTAAARLGVEPSACVAIEDSVPGLRAAHGAGMRTIAVTTTSASATLSMADRIVGTVADVTPELVAELGRLDPL
jgi:HAD superfamily hydrolase (TIGR01509 family)